MKKAALVLVRHGNTFGEGDKIVWVGARTDMPLTAKGEQQARCAALYIAEKFPSIVSIATGPLKRTRSMAAIIAEKMSMSCSLDDRLCEIDYGKWEGLSSEEIAALYGQDVLDQWDKTGVWPENMEWKPTLNEIKSGLQSFLNEMSAEILSDSAPRLAVTSNGILRIIHSLITPGASPAAAKVKTGNICVIEPGKSGWKIISWDLRPV
ncbi:MAG: histidine phosphatase family protein [Alphaproteobacteria bacterium]|nr:histidine phosphatase family protein [Alphaproteobacteria bacterium]